MLKKTYFVYIISNVSKTLYIGMTNDLKRRVYEHKIKLFKGFTSRYNFTHRIYFKETDDITITIGREKQLKGMGIETGK